MRLRELLLDQRLVAGELRQQGVGAALLPGEVVDLPEQGGIDAVDLVGAAVADLGLGDLDAGRHLHAGHRAGRAHRLAGHAGVEVVWLDDQVARDGAIECAQKRVLEAVDEHGNEHHQADADHQRRGGGGRAAWVSDRVLACQPAGLAGRCLGRPFEIQPGLAPDPAQDESGARQGHAQQHAAVDRVAVGRKRTRADHEHELQHDRDDTRLEHRPAHDRPQPQQRPHAGDLLKQR
jgi:hypothetical protein